MRRSVDSRVSYLAHSLTLLALSLLALAPLLYPGYLQVHSGFLPVFNLADLAAAGDKLRWLPAVGTAPDLLRGEGPLAWWLALPLRPFGGDLAAIKLIFAGSVLLGAAALLGNGVKGLLRATLFLFWPPLLMTLTVRGALAETLFIGLFALAFGIANYELRITHDRQRAAASTLWTVYAVLATVYFLLFWTQPGLALWATALLLVWTLAQRQARAAIAIALGALLGGGAYWALHRSLPSPTLDVASHAVYPFQLLSPAWGFGVSVSGWQDTLPLQLGFAALSLAALALILHPPRASGSSSLLFTAYCLLFTILLTVIRPLWQLGPLAATLTYPWQLYALLGPLLIWLAGEALSAIPALTTRPALAALIALVVLASYSYLAPRFTQVQPDPARPQIFQPARVTLLESAVQGPIGEIGATQALTVTLAWQPLQPVNFDYNVFIHATDAAGNRVAQWDGQPMAAGASAPMTQWAAGEVVTSDYRLDMPAGSPPARLLIGLYNWQTGERLTVNGDDVTIVEMQP